MRVLIVSKTHMPHGQCCMGGLTFEGESIRLVMQDGHYPPDNTDLTPGHIYNMQFVPKHSTKPPHIEDVLVQAYTLHGALEKPMLEFVKELGVSIWNGGPDELFDGKLQWTDSGSGYINEEEIPAQSVGFWVPDQPLRKSIYYEKVRYSCNLRGAWYSLPYIGYDEPVEVIPAGTLIRVSLARWWDQNGTTELRCPLQLSGWYNL
ncbi:MAG: hypothetical protein J7599_14580 [Niabella sp.]|nr:hypothetical protein [Niabella sp.]